MAAILDPVRPYLWALKLAGWCLLAAVLVLGGCRWEHARMQGKVEQAQAKQKAAEDQADGYVRTLNTINDQTKAAVAAAAQEKAKADAAVKSAQKVAEESRQRAASAEAALQAAKRNPTCRSQLEMQLCDSIPLL